MTKTFARVATSLFTATLAWGLAGCSSPATESTPAPTSTQSEPTTTASAPTTAAASDQQEALDAYLAALQAQIPSILETYKETYSDIRILSAPPSTIEYAYVYLQQGDPDAVAASLDAYIPTLQTLCDTRLFPEMEGAGITVDPKVRYTYYNADGTKIWTHVFERS
jgi:hypothetical protein